MTDRELLELAAKAAGYSEFCIDEVGEAQARKQNEVWASWNPLTDCRDAFFLARALRIAVYFGPECYAEITTLAGRQIFEEPMGDDPMAAHCRAIVRAAAELGKRMD